MCSEEENTEGEETAEEAAGFSVSEDILIIEANGPFPSGTKIFDEYGTFSRGK